MVPYLRPAPSHGPASDSANTKRVSCIWDLKPAEEEQHVWVCGSCTGLWLWKEASCLGVLIFLLFFFFFFHKHSLADCLISEQGYFAIIVDCFVLIYFHGMHRSRATPWCTLLLLLPGSKTMAAEIWGDTKVTEWQEGRWGGFCLG